MPRHAGDAILGLAAARVKPRFKGFKPSRVAFAESRIFLEPMSIPAAPSETDGPETSLPKNSGGVFYGTMAGLLLLAGLGFGVGLLPKLQRHQEAVATARDLSKLRVRTATPQPAPDGKPLSLSGELKPAVEATLLARVSGYVRHWNADLGDRVEAGQVLAELDTPELGRELSRARAQLSLAEAALALSEITAKRWRELLASRSASQQEADEKDADLHLKQAALEAARAEVQRLEEISGFSKITAPFSGTITARRIDVGQLVEAGGARELFRLAQTSHLRVFVRVPQAYARSVQIGAPAEITLPEVHGRTFTAKVVRSAGALEAASRTLLTELEVDNRAGELLSGSYAQVRIQGAREEKPLTVPANSLIYRSEGAQIAVVGTADRVQFRNVTLGRDYGQVVEVVSGVTTGERVVQNPADSLTDGSTVEVVP